MRFRVTPGMTRQHKNKRHPELDSGSHLSEQPRTSQPKTENRQNEMPGHARNDETTQNNRHPELDSGSHLSEQLRTSELRTENRLGDSGSRPE
ncbi:hypothetical protein [Salegentibacter sediminis]|uniref:hypothetical protein n=1 Tax=Salegentibacter sediminis TaxID=1930251 RepID=UPI0012FF67EF|nr:hypothetical protein [Salegentibacter sediminis]